MEVAYGAASFYEVWSIPTDRARLRSNPDKMYYEEERIMKNQLLNRLMACTMTAVMGAAILTGCQKSQSEDAVAEKTETAATETVAETAAKEETETAAEAPAQETAEAAKPEETASSESEFKAPYFKKGVYSSYPTSEADAERTYFYVFYDEGAGYTEDGNSGIGLPFACEQTDGTVVFHMGGADEESKEIYTVESVENGVITGTYENGNRISFSPEPSADPDNFDAQKFIGTAQD